MSFERGSGPIPENQGRPTHSNVSLRGVGISAECCFSLAEREPGIESIEKPGAMPAPGLDLHLDPTEVPASPQPAPPALAPGIADRQVEVDERHVLAGLAGQLAGQIGGDAGAADPAARADEAR